MYPLYNAPINTKYTVMYCNYSIILKSTPSGCIQHAKPLLTPKFQSYDYITWKKNEFFMLYANIHQLYCNRMQPENFFYRHFFWTLSAINTTTDPKVLQPKSHDMKKKRCFVPIYISYTAIYCNRDMFSKSTPSGCFQHVKTPLIPNFGVLFHRVTLTSLTDWTIGRFCRWGFKLLIR